MLDGPAETVKLNDRRRVIAANAVLQSYVDCVQGQAGAFLASVKFENQTQFAEPPRITVGGRQTTSQTSSVTTNADGAAQRRTQPRPTARRAMRPVFTRRAFPVDRQPSGHSLQGISPPGL